MANYETQLVDPRPLDPPEDNTPETECTCIVDGAFGIYMPQQFCQRYQKTEGVSQEDWDICLAGPNHKEYWYAWDCILGDWQVTETDDSGNVWKVYIDQDGDLFQYREFLYREK